VGTRAGRAAMDGPVVGDARRDPSPVRLTQAHSRPPAWPSPFGAKQNHTGDSEGAGDHQRAQGMAPAVCHTLAAHGSALAVDVGAVTDHEALIHLAFVVGRASVDRASRHQLGTGALTAEGSPPAVDVPLRGGDDRATALRARGLRLTRRNAPEPRPDRSKPVRHVATLAPVGSREGDSVMSLD
jgi:hypothetical protein